MVIKIHQTESTKDAFYYNEQKVEEDHARFLHSRNTNELTPFVYSQSQRLEQLLAIENGNTRCRNKCFHVSVNPTPKELEKLTKAGIKKEIDAFMKNMGYGHQPYFVYEHADLKRTHFHIVSTRIDANTGKKISDSNEKRKVSQFIQELQQRYQLETSKIKPEKVQLIPTVNNTNMHESIQQVIKLLNRSNVANQQEYLDILKAFNLELYQSEQGQSILVKDQDGRTLRHPISLSQFKESPNLKDTLTSETNEQLQQELKLKTERILKELNKSYRFYTNIELREAFIKHNLLPYKLTKNGNINIYSPLDKTVVDAQFLLKKNKMRLQQFTLSNDRFYGIIRELTEQRQQANYAGVEALIDIEKSVLNNGENRKIVLKELDLEACEIYNQLASQFDVKEQKTVKKAIQSHLEYIAVKAMDKVQNPSKSYQEKQSRSYWEKLNYQFMIELLNYQDWQRGKGSNKRKSIKNHQQRRKWKRF
ncbi:MULTISPECIES: relaxase/mobilization nuclease domain-containing protein [unclassified Carboxylicivirga]|uniref:relaxase/mobilization nuclease domain-containing protein n=1 Tax=Carboxylicivirga TaxID=1628153 RepID=UPI003D353557